LKLAVLLSLSFLCACQPKTPEAVADKFVDLYFVEIDQQRALALSSGLARTKLEEELGLVEKIRHNYVPDQAKPSIYYVRRSSQLLGDHARFSYDLTIKQGRDESQRNVLLSLEQVDGAWRVGNFIVKEGYAPTAPPTGTTAPAPAPAETPPAH
jgi:hypothetical protein